MMYIIFTLIIFALVVDYLFKKRRNCISSGIPGPAEVPLIGSYLIFKVKNVKDVIRYFFELDKLYNGFFRAWVFHRLGVMISRPDYLECILGSTRHIKKVFMYNILQSWLGEGLLMSYGSKWHARRKIITPAFHFKILEQFVEIFDKQSGVLVDQLEKHANDNSSFDIQPYIKLAALDIVCETAMGVKINAQTDASGKYVQAVSIITNITMQRFANAFLHFNVIFNLFQSHKRKMCEEALKELHSFTKTVIQKRCESLERDRLQSNLEAGDNKELGVKKKLAFLDILLQSSINGRPLSNSEIQEEVDTFMFEGHDTITSGISFTLYLLSRNRNVQDRLFEEIQHVFGTPSRTDITYDDLQKLKYLECVIKESLRMYPPVPMIGREITEDTYIDGYGIPAGTSLIIPIFLMMKNPKIFPNPENFDPNRHLAENTTEMSNPYAYIPFSAGPRNCIGQKFAILEMKTILSKLLMSYELLPIGEAPDQIFSIVTKSSNGIKVGIKKRN